MRLTAQVRSPWFVGYHPEMNEMFLYFIDEDDLTWIFRRGAIDVIGFSEFMNFDKAILLGEL